jgi:hypothetical protein
MTHHGPFTETELFLNDAWCHVNCSGVPGEKLLAMRILDTAINDVLKEAVTQGVLVEVK